MIKFNERIAATVLPPENPDKVLFLNPDGVLQLKDSAGTLTNVITESSTGLSTARPFKVYKALLTQTGTDAPVATVFENTLGGTVVWSYEGTGTCHGTLAGAFPENKLNIGNNIDVLIGEDGAEGKIIYLKSGAPDYIAITTLNNYLFSGGININGIPNAVPILIEVYP